jgi:hypothetical protein
MFDQEIKRIQNLIHVEEKLGGKAGSPEIAAAHRQVAKLYKTALNVVRRRRAAAVAEMLCGIA